MKYYFTAVMIACLILSGCGKKANEKLTEKMIEAAAAKDGIKADVDIDDETVTIKTDEGTSTFSSGSKAKIPDNFPKDVYVYEKADIVSALSVPDGFSIMLQTKDAPDKVSAAIKARFTASGWTEEMTMNQGGMVMLGYRKGDRSSVINVMRDDKMTQISITVGSENQ